jgi:hypothetical protein
MTTEWLKLTRINGNPIYLNLAHAVSIRRFFPDGKDSYGDRTIITFLVGKAQVTETPEEILRLGKADSTPPV